MSLIRIAILTVAVLFVASMCRADELVEVKEIPADRAAAIKVAEADVQSALANLKKAQELVSVAASKLERAKDDSMKDIRRHEPMCSNLSSSKTGSSFRRAKVSGKFILVEEGIAPCGGLTWSPAISLITPGTVTLDAR